MFYRIGQTYISWQPQMLGFCQMLLVKNILYSGKKTILPDRGGGQVVSVLAFYSDDLSSNPA